MISIHNIASIAKYERKTLFRSWFFRIAGILSLVILFFLNFGIVSDAGQPMWMVRAIPSTIPYFNLLFLNTIQAIIAVFLASDFLRRDKKLDTTEVIYMRSMTNGEYVIGKTLGNIQVFLTLNFVALFMALIFNLVTSGVSVSWLSYIIYLGIISIPTLIFIMGLSFLVMSVLRNQAVTMILILGYIGATLFLLQANYYYLFDYMAFNLPMLQSEFIGFGNLPAILIHRGMYLSLGIGFIFMAIYLLKRLPQSESVTLLSLVFSALFIGGGIYLGYQHINRFVVEENLREEIIALNNEYIDKQFPLILDQTIHLKHIGSKIEVTSEVLFENNTGSQIEELIVRLNPGLEVTSIEFDASPLKFTRNKHLVFIDKALSNNDQAEITIKYKGSINEAVCYLDVDNETRSKKFGDFIVNTDKRSAFIYPNYVLLTPETNWYPISGVSYTPEDAGWYSENFINFQLEVETSDSLKAISQGEIISKRPGSFVFKPEQPLTQISLAIGNYKQKYFERDSVRFGVWYLSGHDFFSNSLPEITDTIPQLITDRFGDFQREFNLTYTFKRLSIVEVPAQFKSFERIFTSKLEYIQPEQVLMHEKAYLLRDADFNTRIKREKKNAKRHNESLTDKDLQERALSNFLGNFTRSDGRMSFSRGQGGNFEASENVNPYYMFPVLYNFQNNIFSKEWPIVNRIFEAYLKSQGTTSMRSSWMRNMSGGSEDEDANLALQEKTFAELLTDTEQRQIIDNVIKLKGDVLFNLIQSKAGEDKFKAFLNTLIEENKFKNIDFEEFNNRIEKEFGIELSSFMASWFNEKGMPQYLFSPIKAVKVKSGGQMKTMVSFKVSNMSENEGIVKLTIRLGGGGRGRGFRGRTPNPDDQINKIVYLDKRQTKDISYLLNSDPRALTINTLTSSNIPQLITHRFTKIEEDDKAKPVDGETISEKAVAFLEPNEIILDNEDPGFEVTANASSSLLKDWLWSEDENEKKYSGITPWRPPVKWTNTTNSDYYGKYIRSAYYIKSGEGDQVATWNIPIKEGSYYDVYYHVYKSRRFGRRGRDEKGEYNFSIFHDDGKEEQTLEIHNADAGWNHLGSYYFSPDTAKIELSNKSEISVVFADAVKLVKL